MPSRRIKKLLIANRGEIALRIQRTCREMGIATVAVYSEPDADMPFVEQADEAVALGGAAPRESYLNVDALLAAAKRTHADAIHPGYGFLSENAAFARQVGEAGLTFVGPTPKAMEMMGSKIGARKIMSEAGVPIVPGAEISGLSDTQVLEHASSVGFPVLVKASFGGGGRGMRIVEKPGELLDAVASARREAGSAFGNDTVFLERYVASPRHVELQIFGDEHGNVVHLFERECSIQRRHQKIIEEAPSPAVNATLRQQMGDAAVKAARAIGYLGAGTVEFILAPDGKFFFLEVNTRLQVEHPVTEAITGLDLVRLQLMVAQGEPLPLAALKPTMKGYAIEARLYAEDAKKGYLPVAGRLETFELPGDVRVDSGFRSGSEVSIHYDSMLAKVIAAAPTREEAAQHLASALRRARIHGLTTNRDLLVEILEHPEFLEGKTDTHFLLRHPPEQLLAAGVPETTVRVHALVAVLAAQAERRDGTTVNRDVVSGFRNNPSLLQQQDLRFGETTYEVRYRLGRGARFEVNGANLEGVLLHRVTASEVVLTAEGIRHRFHVAVQGLVAYVDSPLGATALTSVPRFPESEDEAASGSLIASMPGKVIRVNVSEGQRVEKGTVLLVLEAMKMEHAVASPAKGKVASLRVVVGDTVAGGDVLAVVESEAT